LRLTILSLLMTAILHQRRALSVPDCEKLGRKSQDNTSSASKKGPHKADKDRRMRNLPAGTTIARCLRFVLTKCRNLAVTRKQLNSFEYAGSELVLLGAQVPEVNDQCIFVDTLNFLTNHCWDWMAVPVRSSNQPHRQLLSMFRGSRDTGTE
jgi:hypothetical protein